MPLVDDLTYMWSVWSGFACTAAFRHGFTMAGSSPVLKQQLMQEWVTSKLNILLPVMSDEWTHQRLYCEDITPGTAPPQEWVGSLTQQGLDSSGSLPGQISVITTWYSPLQGRANRGRTYWPGVASGQLLSGLLGGTASSAFNAYAAAMLASWGADAVLPYARLGTISRQLNGSPRGPELIETSDWVTHISLGVQKRRASGAGGGP